MQSQSIVKNIFTQKTRRAMDLKKAIRIIFGMTMIGSSISGFCLEKSPKVVVIGGGIAGLTAAYRLQKNGMDVDIYEAKGRVGGRIFTTKINGHTAELGGQNIGDGGEAVHLNRLIDEFGLELLSSRVYLNHFYFTGQDLIPIKELLKEKRIDPKTIKNKIDSLVRTSSNMKEILEKIVDSEDLLYKILAVRMAAYEGGPIESLSPMYAKTLFHMMLGGICSAHQESPKDYSYVDRISIKGGNSVLCEKIRESLEGKVHLNMPLIKVTKEQDSSFMLTFQNGKKLQADILVLAIPCTVYESITFGANVIPLQKLDAIRKVQYGKNAKIMVPFEKSLSKTSGLVNDKIVVLFDTMEQLLTVYYTGETSLFSPDTITNAYVEARSMIEMGFGGDCPSFSFPEYAKDGIEASYDRPVGYSWPNDPYARGSYSYIASGQEDILTSTELQRGETFKTLFAPIENTLYFAGEHASILFEASGTMEAACESGERVARTILQSKENGMMKVEEKLGSL